MAASSFLVASFFLGPEGCSSSANATVASYQNQIHTQKQNLDQLLIPMPAKLGESKPRGKGTYSERFDDGVLVRAGLTAELVADFGD